MRRSDAPPSPATEEASDTRGSEQASPEESSPAQRPGRKSRRPLRADLAGVLVACSFVLIAFFPIVFQGKTLSAASNGPAGTNGEQPFPGQPIDHRPMDYRIDLAASTWAFEPWAQVVHREFSEGIAPLWNPYQGDGTPLAANMQSAVFDPLLLPVDLDPTQGTWDLALLGAFLLGAAAAYAYARVLGLDIVPSVAASAAFSLSGFFFLYSNDQFSRSYVYLPILFLLVELVLRSRRALPVAGLAVAVAANIYAGMPEVSALVIGTSLVYALVRMLQHGNEEPVRTSGARLALGFLSGGLLAAPLLLLFQQYQGISFNTHQAANGSGTQVDPIRGLLNWVVPFFNGSKSPASGNLPRNWSGAAATVAALVGLSGRRETRRLHGLLFAAIAAVFILKMHNFHVLAWIGHLPLLDRIIYPVYAPLVAGFAVAILAGIGVQVLWRRDLHVKRFLALLAGYALVVIVLTVVNYHEHVIPSFVPAVWERVALAGGVVVIAALLIVHQRPKLAATLAGAAIVAELISLAPHGIYAPRANPYVPPDWLPAVQRVLASEPDGRVFAIDAKLFPDTAGALGLQDIRALDAIYVDRYWRFVKRFLQPTAVDRFNGGPYASGEKTVAQYRNNPMFDALAVRVILSHLAVPHGPTSINTTVDGLTLRGHIGTTYVYENADAYPRAWVVHRVDVVRDENSAFALLKARSATVGGAAILHPFDPRAEAVVEQPSGSVLPPGRNGPTCRDDLDRVSVASYAGDSVKLNVDATCPGLLVLPDTYYPGWSVTVNGRRQSIYPTDGALRGVVVPRGASIVRFEYHPSRFRWGVVIAVVTLLTLLGFVAGGWWTRRRRAETV